MISKNQFYSYAIFISWMIVFFAVLAIFYSFMEHGIILPTLHQYNDKEHKFQWMKDAENREEPITDLTYRDNITLDNKIANLKDPEFIKEIQQEHIEELKQMRDDLDAQIAQLESVAHTFNVNEDAAANKAAKKRIFWMPFVPCSIRKIENTPQLSESQGMICFSGFDFKEF